MSPLLPTASTTCGSSRVHCAWSLLWCVACCCTCSLWSEAAACAACACSGWDAQCPCGARCHKESSWRSSLAPAACLLAACLLACCLPACLLLACLLAVPVLSSKRPFHWWLAGHPLGGPTSAGGTTHTHCGAGKEGGGCAEGNSVQLHSSMDGKVQCPGPQTVPSPPRPSHALFVQHSHHQSHPATPLAHTH